MDMWLCELTHKGDEKLILKRKVKCIKIKSGWMQDRIEDL